MQKRDHLVLIPALGRGERRGARDVIRSNAELQERGSVDGARKRRTPRNL